VAKNVKRACTQRKTTMADGVTNRKAHQPLQQVGGMEATKPVLAKVRPDDNGRDEIITFIVQTNPDRFVCAAVIFIISYEELYMKLLQLKPAILAAAVLSVSAYTGLASAHCFNGSTLGTAAKAADLYQVMCFNDGVNGAPTRLIAQPNLTAGGSGVMVTVAKPNFSPVTGSDTTNGGAITLATCSGASLGTQASLSGAAGNYDILVQKASTTSDVTAKTYGMVFHCLNASGVETGTSEVVAGDGTGLIAPAPGDMEFLINQ
jgi:hypothetical protein